MLREVFAWVLVLLLAAFGFYVIVTHVGPPDLPEACECAVA